MKGLYLLLIVSVGFFLICSFALAATPGGHYDNLQLGGPLPGIAGCDVCHASPTTGFPGLPLETTPNIWWIPTHFSWNSKTYPDPQEPYTVKFTTLIWPEGAGDPDGTLADKQVYNPGEYADGPCEVCHTQTKYYRNDGTSPGADGILGTEDDSHYPPSERPDRNCTSCHRHFRVVSEWFEPVWEGEQAHDMHFYDLRGPRILEGECETCHYPSDYELFGPNGDTLADTDVCDKCHSPGEAYDGVDHPDLGAK